MNRVEAGFFSLSHRSATGDDGPYLEWHQMDHMPEQYQLPGLVLGQRWASTPACRATRAAEIDDWSLVEHVVCYLMGDPLGRTVDDFFALGGHLADLGRFPYSLPSQYRGGLRLLEAHAASRVLVSPEVVPFRPHRGVYLIVDEPDATDQDRFVQRIHVEIVPELLSVPGVAGVWTFATSASFRYHLFSEGKLRVALCYLDDEPAAVSERLAPLVDRIWGDAPSRLLLAAGFESLVRWDPSRFS